VGERELNDGQSVKQILAKLAFRHFFPQVFIAAGDDAHVNSLNLPAPTRWISPSCKVRRRVA
jgi:hypothetical protein